MSDMIAGDRSYVAENAIQRERLRSLIARLSDEELSREVCDGWTIAATLAHVAFWDQRVLNLLHRFERSGVGPSPLPPDVDAINDAMRALCLAISPRAATQLAIDSVDAVDRRLELLSDEVITQIQAAGNPIKFLRAEHRKYHLDEIEPLLISTKDTK